jgi:hypothetical protein
MVLTVYLRALPGDRLFCHRHQADMAGPRPVGPTSPPRDLTPASGCQDHTISPSASAPFVSTPLTTHRPPKTRPAITCRAQRCRVHRIPPRARDDRDTPLQWDGTAVDIQVIWVFGKPEYFFKRGWTDVSRNSLSGKSVRGLSPARARLRATRWPAHPRYTLLMAA